MNWSNVWWISYGLIVLTRVMAFKMRLRLPGMRGPETFFGCKVPPDFYSGPGRRIMRAYYFGIAVPPILEALLIAPIIYWGHPGWIMTVLFATSFALIIWARINVKRVTRLAKPFIVSEEQPPAAVSLQFETRRLISYRNLPMDALVWIFNLAAVLLVADSVRLALGIENTTIHSVTNLLLRLSGLAKPDAAALPSGAWLFWPLVLIYIQIGATLMKHAVLAWPMRMSTGMTEAHRNYREDIRRYMIRSCDWFRLVFSLALLTSTIELRFPELNKGGRFQWFGYALHIAIVIVILVWYQINARKLLQQARELKLSRALPRNRTVSDPARFRLGGLVYFDPDSPSVLIPSRSGYALNFADRRAYISLAYVTGLLALALIHLRFGWG
jgi:uncharacterized membrane protein